MSGDTRLVRALVACYPAGWRRRYGDEYAQLLCDLRVHRHPRMIVDSLRGAVRVHGGALMTSDSPMTVLVWAAGLFTVAGIGFAKLAEDVAGEARGMYALLVVAAAVALLALAGAAVPTAVALLRGRDTGAWKYVALPVVGAVLWYGTLRLALAISDGHRVHSAPNVAAFLLISASGIAVVAATAWAAARGLRRVRAEQPARLRPTASITVAGAMAVATIAAVIWGLRIRSLDPDTYRGAHGILATPFPPSWIAVVAALGDRSAQSAEHSDHSVTFRPCRERRCFMPAPPVMVHANALFKRYGRRRPGRVARRSGRSPPRE